MVTKAVADVVRVGVLVLVAVALIRDLAIGQTAVAGIVTDAETDEPLAGARIFLEGSTVSDISDSEGRFFLGPVQGGLRFVEARLQGYQPSTARIVVPLGMTATVNFVMWSEILEYDEWDDPAVEVSGRITENGIGAPLAGASVLARPGKHSVKTDRVGRFSIVAHESIKQLEISLPCFAGQTIELGENEFGPLDISLTLDPATAPKNVRCVPPPDCTECPYFLRPGEQQFYRPTFFGQVTDAETGEPISEVGIRLYRTSYDFQVADRTRSAERTRADDQGYYAIDAPLGTMVLEFKARCHLTVQLPFYNDGMIRRIDVSMPFFYRTMRGSDGQRRGCERTADGWRDLRALGKAIDRVPATLP